MDGREVCVKIILGTDPSVRGGKWRAWHHDELAGVLVGSHAVIAIQVVEFLAILTPASTSALLEFMHSHSWERVDAHTKLVLLHKINETIARMREKNNMRPIDDPLPGAPRNAFQRICTIMFPALAGKADVRQRPNPGQIAKQ
jgi:hypothetical protein